MNSNVIKEIFKLQHAKIDLMFETITRVSEIVAKSGDVIPKSVLGELAYVLENFLKNNERLDELRQDNIDSFYNKIRNKYESIYNMEVSNEKEEEN